jgi:1-acyl-sn-glycerol-3-phosphate acyltransferase
MRMVCKVVVFFKLRATIIGMENFPKQGPALVVINHLGDADAVLLAAALPMAIEGMGKIELYDHWLVGPVFRAYGVIWVHRGQPDRKAIRAALEGLADGRMIVIAPEGRQSLNGKLEAGNEGAAYLAMKSGAMIVPIAMTGTENNNVFDRKRWERAPATLTVGKPFKLQEQADRQKMMREGTDQIMESLANLLPDSYVGNYKANHE